VDCKILFIAVGFDDCVFEPCKDVPIEMSEVVAIGVLSIVVKLDTDAFLFGQSLTANPAMKRFTRREAQPFKDSEFGRCKNKFVQFV